MKPLKPVEGWDSPINLMMRFSWATVEHRFGVSGLKKQHLPGIYYLFDGGEIVYIGQSKDLFVRLLSHLYDDSKTFDGFNYKSCKISKLDKKERKAIKKHRPKYNIVHNR